MTRAWRAQNESIETERPLPALRQARWAGPGVIAVVVAVAAVQDPRPALSGTGLAVSLALVVLVASTVAMFGPTASLVAAAGLAAMIAASGALVWLQPGGAGVAGLFVVVASAGLQLTHRRSLATLVLAAAAFVAAALHQPRSGGTIAGAELGIVAFYLFARFARSAAEAHETTSRLLAELQASRNAEAEAAMLRERSRLARDMHDVLAHSLSGLMLQLEGARMLVAQPDADGQLPPALDRAHHLARAGLEEARRAIAALRDEDLPGPDRLEQLAAEFEQDSNIRASLELQGTPRRLDSEVALTLYRVAQEALTNARRHAVPDRVRLRLSYEADAVRLTIADHASTRPARVAAVTSVGGGYGLTGMRERAKLIGGRLDARPTPDGFQVELWIPA
jgi:signal transduction histidine kinase